MPYRLLADVVVCVHLAFVLFAALGGLLALRWRWVPWVHVPAAVWAGFVEITGRICPLTPLENRLREAAGAGMYAGDFVEHYVVPLVYPPALTRDVQMALAALLVMLNLGIYTAVWWRGTRDARQLSRDNSAPPRHR